VGPSAREPHILDLQKHRLHGVLHANGFGHLARICGREAGSASLRGAALLSLWDRLCVSLRARLVSVEDVSTKAGLPLRLLAAAAGGATWYGAAGYAFGRGGFGIGRGAHKRAVEALHRFPLASLRADFAALPPGGDEGVLSVISRYEGYADAAAAARRAPGRRKRMGTLGELLSLLLALCGGREAPGGAAEQQAGLPALPGAAGAGGTPAGGAPAGGTPSGKPRLIMPPLPDATPPPPPPPKAAKRPGTRAASPQQPSPAAACRWSAARVAAAGAACVAALRAAAAAAAGWQPRAAVRTAARGAIGDTGLLDHVLKSLQDMAPLADGLRIARRMNRATKTLEAR
jgi:hypothetical protein